MNGSPAAIVRRGLAPPWAWVCLGFSGICPMTASVLCRGAIPAPSPQLAHIWRLLEESACSLQPGLAELALLSFFINHPLLPPDPACPAPLNLLQFVSSEQCRVLPARPGVAVVGLTGKEGPSSICRQAALPAVHAFAGLCWLKPKKFPY